MLNEQEKINTKKKLKEIINFASVNVCRRKQILTYFNEVYEEENCGNCDVCCEEVEKIEATRDAQVILSTIARTNQTFGAVHIVDIIYGADTKKIWRCRCFVQFIDRCPRFQVALLISLEAGPIRFFIQVGDEHAVFLVGTHCREHLISRGFRFIIDDDEPFIADKLNLGNAI